MKLPKCIVQGEGNIYSKKMSLFKEMIEMSVESCVCGHVSAHFTGLETWC